MEAIRFKPQSESRFVSNPIAPGVGQINSGILTLSGSIHSRNLTITSIHKVGQTIPGIPGSDDSRNKWVRLFPEYMGEVIPGIGGSEVSGIFIQQFHKTIRWTYQQLKLGQFTKDGRKGTGANKMLLQ
jgi:hypothetical protein